MPQTPENSEGDGQARPAYVLPDGRGLAADCRSIREKLYVNHVHYADTDGLKLSRDLIAPDSRAMAILGSGFFQVVVLDAIQGVGVDGVFDLSLFLRYAARQMAIAFDHSLVESDFHPEQISQILKDEPRSLFCFVNIFHIPYESLQRLRSFTQEVHSCLFCGPHTFSLKTQPEIDDDDSSDEPRLIPESAPPLTEAELRRLHETLFGQDSGISLDNLIVNATDTDDSAMDPDSILIAAEEDSATDDLDLRQRLDLPLYSAIPDDLDDWPSVDDQSSLDETSSSSVSLSDSDDA